MPVTERDPIDGETLTKRLGPAPAMTLDILSDLGMSDPDIARYFAVEPGWIAAARIRLARQARSSERPAWDDTRH